MSKPESNSADRLPSDKRSGAGPSDLRKQTDAEVYERRERIIEPDPRVLRRREQADTLTLEGRLLLDRYKIAENLAYRLHRRQLTEAKDYISDPPRSFNVWDLLTTVGGKRWAVQEAFREALAPAATRDEKSDLQIFDQFKKWEIGGDDEENASSPRLMALARRSLRQLLADSPKLLHSANFEKVVTTRFFPILPKDPATTEKAIREWESFWKPVVEWVGICTRGGVVEAAGNKRTFKLIHAFFPGQLDSRKAGTLDEIFEAFGRELKLAFDAGRLPYADYAPMVVSGLLNKIQALVEECERLESLGTQAAVFEDSLTPPGELRQGPRVGEGKVRGEFGKASVTANAGERNLLKRAEALADSVRPAATPPEITELQTILAAAREDVPTDKARFIRIVEKILRETNYCFRLPDGEIARRLYVDRNGIIGLQCTSGSKRGFKSGDYVLAPYMRPYKKGPPPASDPSPRLK